MENALEKLTKADQWLAEAETLDELKQIHDIGVAAEAYAQAHRLGLSAENHAMGLRLLAGRRIGELVPAEQGKRTDKELVHKTDKLEIAKQRLSDFRKLVNIPEQEFQNRIDKMKEKREKITFNKMLQPQKEVMIQGIKKKRQPNMLSQLQSLWLRANDKTRKNFLVWIENKFSKKEEINEFRVKC